MRANYDVIGINYAELRKPDPRIAGIIESALGSAQAVLNVGAGTGSYEPTGRSLIAVEPSREMIRKRGPAAYLDPHVRSGSSSFWAIGDAEAGLQRLRRDLETGEWERRYAELLALDEYDAGYRLVVAG